MEDAGDVLPDLPPQLKKMLDGESADAEPLTARDKYDLRTKPGTLIAGSKMVQDLMVMAQDLDQAIANGPAIKAPPLAEKLLYLVLSKPRRETVLGDLQEDFHNQPVPKFGPRFARFWYWIRTAREMWSAFKEGLMRLLTSGRVADLLGRLIGL